LSSPIYPQMEIFCACVSLFFNVNPSTMIFFLALSRTAKPTTFFL
jgi:hypothetical protein